MFDYKSIALPAELQGHKSCLIKLKLTFIQSKKTIFYGHKLNLDKILQEKNILCLANY